MRRTIFFLLLLSRCALADSVSLSMDIASDRSANQTLGAVFALSPHTLVSGELGAVESPTELGEEAIYSYRLGLIEIPDEIFYASESISGSFAPEGVSSLGLSFDGSCLLSAAWNGAWRTTGSVGLGVKRVWQAGAEDLLQVDRGVLQTSVSVGLTQSIGDRFDVGASLMLFWYANDRGGLRELSHFVERASSLRFASFLLGMPSYVASLNLGYRIGERWNVSLGASQSTIKSGFGRIGLAVSQRITVGLHAGVTEFLSHSEGLDLSISW